MNTAFIEKIEHILKGMQPVSLAEIDHVKLMQRLDRKYILPADRVPDLIHSLKQHYMVLKIGNTLIHPYETIYYDTPEFSMYHDHHNRRLNRYKVRVRKYLSTDVRYLEVKFKNNKGLTMKRRIIPEERKGIMGESTDRFLQEKSPYSSNQIVPALQNRFYRITLVNKQSMERITVDLGLAFGKVGQKARKEMPHISIVEVKRDPAAGSSEMMKFMRRNHINPMGFSKYCIGTALVHKGVRINLFKRKLRHIGKLEEPFSAIIN